MLCARWQYTRPYKWRLEKADDGTQHLVIPFDDGSKFDYHRDDAPPPQHDGGK